MTPLDILLKYGMPPYKERPPRAPRPDAILVKRTCEPVQLGPVHHSSGHTALYDCPCGCGLWTSEPAKLCGHCNELKPATHWDGLVDTCGDCAGEAYGE
jgi:hypothetical protein